MVYKAPFNYIGNKYRIINAIQELFPTRIRTFVDIFCGGCDVSINTVADSIYANDINHYVIGILKEFQRHSIRYLLNYIDTTIDTWQLSKTNETAYKSFREYYNKTRKPLDLYVLMCYSFNYQFRFNTAHDYNNTFGKDRSSFNDTMRSNLVSFKKQIKNIHFSDLDFREFNYNILTEGDLIYADPPYLISCGSYNDGKRGFKGWTKDDDIALLHILTSLSERGVLFALSNVIEHKGKTNQVILDWVSANAYHIHEINFNYNNCNYHSNNRSNTTKEVLITNY